jgi:membrane protease YdiL (CAAX protease family)
MPATPINIAVLVLELALLGFGVVLLCRHVFSSKSPPLSGRAALLPSWNVSLSDFLLFAFLMIAGGLFAGFVAGLVLARVELSTDARTICASAAFQLGLLAGPAVLPLNLGHPALLPPLGRQTLRTGAATFLIALPVVMVVNLAWLGILKFFDVPAQQQDLLRMFTEADHPLLITLLVILATVVAPLTEELLFRATLFRYVRTRLPRLIALLLPGTIFAALHVNWLTLDGLASFLPLVTLAVVFSIAYERTGQIGTAIVAHALFNLHTILLLVSGVTTEVVP